MSRAIWGAEVATTTTIVVATAEDEAEEADTTVSVEAAEVAAEVTTITAAATEAEVNHPKLILLSLLLYDEPLSSLRGRGCYPRPLMKTSVPYYSASDTNKSLIFVPFLYLRLVVHGSFYLQATTMATVAITDFRERTTLAAAFGPVAEAVVDGPAGAVVQVWFLWAGIDSCLAAAEIQAEGADKV